MATADLERFVQAIVDDHGLATGIKTLGSHYDLVAYANIRGFGITLAEWGRYVAMDSLQASDDAITLALRADPAHWSWAFRQVSKWRGLRSTPVFRHVTGLRGVRSPSSTGQRRVFRSNRTGLRCPAILLRWRRTSRTCA